MKLTRTKSSHLMSGLACIVLLSACATTGPSAGSAAKVAPIGDSLSAADAALKSGQKDKAMAILQGASKAYPTDKAPVVRMAQVHFDADEYGPAIVHAQHVLKLDDDDTVAHSIVAVSGLRVASKALADLTRKNNLSGTIRSEAQDLAKLLRASLNENVLVGSDRRTTAAAQPKSSGRTPAAAPVKKQTSSNDPFEALQ